MPSQHQGTQHHNGGNKNQPQIKILLGKNGSDYAYFVNPTVSSGHDPQQHYYSSRRAQQQQSNQDKIQNYLPLKKSPLSLIPNDLFYQLDYLYNTERYPTIVSYGPNGQWFLAGCRLGVGQTIRQYGDNDDHRHDVESLYDTSTCHYRWGDCSSILRENIQTILRQTQQQDQEYGLEHVCFGYGGQWLLICGKNQCHFSSNLDLDLKDTLWRLNRQRKSIHQIRLFPSGGFFIHHSDGYEWKGICQLLHRELIKMLDNNSSSSSNDRKDVESVLTATTTSTTSTTGARRHLTDSFSIHSHSEEEQQRILDVIVARDENSWIVLHSNGFFASDDIASELVDALQRLYDSNMKTTKFVELESREKGTLEGSVAKHATHATSSAISTANVPTSSPSSWAQQTTRSTAATDQHLRHQRRQREDTIMKIRNVRDFAKQLSEKDIHPGKRVTVVNASTMAGDAVVEEVIDLGLTISILSSSSLLSSSSPVPISIPRGRQTTVRDLRRVVVFDTNQDIHDEDINAYKNEFHQIIYLMAKCRDKYEAAISYYIPRHLINTMYLDFERQRQQPRKAPRSSMNETGKRDHKVFGTRYHDHVDWRQGLRRQLQFGGSDLRHDDGNNSYSDPTIASDAPEHLHMNSPQRGHPAVYVTPERIQDATRIHKTSIVRDPGASPCTVESGSKFTFPESKTRPVLEHRGEALPYDLYKCAEKIDMDGLHRTLTDLATDSKHRANVLQGLEASTSLSCKQRAACELLKQCHDIEHTVRGLIEMLEEFPCDDLGCVVHQVEYEHLDAGYRGRLFAKGMSLVDGKGRGYPRTATLQAIPHELLAPLIGRFAHDVDCENSRTRLICSLATQNDTTDLIPSIVAYRDNRQHWLRLISSCHGVSESVSKRLPVILMSGGRYETWLKGIGLNEEDVIARSSRRDRDAVEALAFNMRLEVRALRDQLLNHPRFRWTVLERQALKAVGGHSDGDIDNILFSRIVEACENDVLSILHGCFVDQGWIVRTKIFDSLLVEPGKTPRMDLSGVMAEAEALCLSQRWDVRLVEKRLYGHHMDSLSTLVAARKALNVVHDMRTLGQSDAATDPLAI